MKFKYSDLVKIKEGFFGGSVGYIDDVEEYVMGTSTYQYNIVLKNGKLVKGVAENNIEKQIQ